MNTELIAQPQVSEFVAAVRDRLRDLPAEDRQELTEGLEADLGDLVAEHGSEALADPEAYARELRVAAGFPPDPAPTGQRRSLDRRITGLLDAAHRRWDGLVTGLPGDPAGLVSALRPAWWVLRAWIALQLVDLLFGGGSVNYGLSVVPSLGSLGWSLLIVAVLVSVQIGRGRLWPGREKAGAFGRVVLLVLNVLAVALIPITFASVYTPAKAEKTGSFADSYSAGYQDAQQEWDRAGIYTDGKWISQIYPYDASGKPLVGVQLFDQEGKPINLVTQTECVYDASGAWDRDHGRVYYHWTNGAAQQRNVVPVPSVVAGRGVSDPDPLAFSRDATPTIGQFPMVSVPSVSLPGLTTSTTRTPRNAYEPGARLQQPINGIDEGC